MSETILKVEHLRQYFNKQTFKAVDDISFEIKKGEIFGLVGESGSGKTTTGRSIIGLNKLTGGRVYFNDRLLNAGTYGLEESGVQKSELKEIIKTAKKQHFDTGIQMIFQDPVASLNPRMTVAQIVGEGLKVQGEKDPEKIYKRVCEVLTQVGLLPEYADRYLHEFSGGQKQRIGIARALIVNPKLIIADECVSALDVSIKAQIINLLSDLRKELGLAVLFIAHDLSVVKYFCDKIAVMNKGKLVEVASSQELFDNPIHPYTKALISAIPVADPKVEQNRQRLMYTPEMHDYSEQKPELLKAGEEHFVYCTNVELEQWKKK